MTSASVSQTPGVINKVFWAHPKLLSFETDWVGTVWVTSTPVKEVNKGATFEAVEELRRFYKGTMTELIGVAEGSGEGVRVEKKMAMPQPMPGMLITGAAF